MVGEFSLFGVREISGLQRKSGYQKRSRAAVTKRRRSMMTKFTLLGVAARSGEKCRNAGSSHQALAAALPTKVWGTANQWTIELTFVGLAV